MKPFYARGDCSATDETNTQSPAAMPKPGRFCDAESVPAPRSYVGRIAVYDSAVAAPRLEDVATSSADTFIEELAARTYRAASDMGGSLPYTVIREVVENLIHADFREPVVSVLDGGHTIRFTDQGPGIPDKNRAVLPGYTTATQRMKEVIRGVGSGLPLVREFLAHEGGSLALEDNLGSGTVVTLHGASRSSGPGRDVLPRALQEPLEEEALLAAVPQLTVRQKRVLSLVMECGEAGPTLISKELSVSLSTAHRDLAFLEECGLISSGETGKRGIARAGTLYLDSLFG